MPSIPLQIDTKALEAAIEQRARQLVDSLRCLVLFVDGEYYGPIDLPITAELQYGDVWDFAGYGRIQLIDVQRDQIHFTRKINKEIAREQPVPPGPRTAPFRFTFFKPPPGVQPRPDGSLEFTAQPIPGLHCGSKPKPRS